MAIPLPLLDAEMPEVVLAHLDHLWFQVGGTLCNLECRHCFISCSPHNRAFGFLRLDMVGGLLEESVALGVKEFYFTGGEPFLNPDLVDILELTLHYGPATVLTNGTVLKDAWLERLQAAEANSPYSLEFRVSIDGWNAATNDPIRGSGTFDRAMHGVRLLLRYGFLPLITVAAVDEHNDSTRLFQEFVQSLRANGYERPRIKVLPVLRIRAESERCRGYHGYERVTPEMMEGFDKGHLLCSHSRIVTDRGVYVCPILIEAPGAYVGKSLAESLGPFPLRYQACHTCYQYGSLCANPSSGIQGE